MKFKQHDIVKEKYIDKLTGTIKWKCVKCSVTSAFVKVFHLQCKGV